MGQYDASLGAMLISSWLNFGLYALEIYQVIYVLTQFPKDRLGLKLMILGSLLTDTMCTIATCANVYIYCVSFWGESSALLLQYWTLPMYCGTTAIAATIVQCFLTYRFWVLSSNKVLTATFIVLIITTLVGAFVTVFTLIIYPAYADRYRNIVPVSIWFVTTAVVDLALAFALVWQLNSVQSSFKSTQSLVRRLTSLSVKTGLVTSLLATSVLITFLQDNQSNIAVALNYLLGRVYSHSMLYNLSSRRSAQHFPSNGLSYTNDLELSHDDARNRSDSNRSNGNRAGSPLHFQPSTATFVSAIDIPSVKVEVSRTVHIQEDLKQSGLFDNDCNLMSPTEYNAVTPRSETTTMIDHK